MQVHPEVHFLKKSLAHTHKEKGKGILIAVGMGLAWRKLKIT